MIQKLYIPAFSVFAVMFVPLMVLLGESHEENDPSRTQSRSDPDFVVSLTVSGGEVNGNPIPYVLRFGFKPEATDGYDEGNEFWTGDQYAPPPPPPPSFDAALSWQQDRYYIQILNGSADDQVEHDWDIQLSNHRATVISYFSMFPFLLFWRSTLNPTSFLIWTVIMLFILCRFSSTRYF